MGPGGAELNRVGAIELGWGSGGLTLQRITWAPGWGVDPPPALVSQSLPWGQALGHPLLDSSAGSAATEGPQLGECPNAGSVADAIATDCLQLLAPHPPLLTEPDFLWSTSLPRSGNGSSWVPANLMILLLTFSAPGAVGAAVGATMCPARPRVRALSVSVN